MNRGPAILKGILLLLAIVALGVAIGWWSGNGNPHPAPVANEADNGTPSHESTEPVAPATVEQTPQPLQQPSVADPVPAPAPQNQLQAAIPAGAPTVMTNWEEALDTILASETEEKEKAREMASIFPKLPAEGQVEVAQHLSNLVGDEDYSMISGFLTNSTLSEDVLDVFIADSLNRPNAEKLPVLLDVARQPGNPKAAEAKEILELFLDEDYGNDWPTWQSKIQEWIVNNPD